MVSGSSRNSSEELGFESIFDEFSYLLSPTTVHLCEEGRWVQGCRKQLHQSSTQMTAPLQECMCLW